MSKGGLTISDLCLGRHARRMLPQAKESRCAAACRGATLVARRVQSALSWEDAAGDRRTPKPSPPDVEADGSCAYMVVVVFSSSLRSEPPQRRVHRRAATSLQRRRGGPSPASQQRFSVAPAVIWSSESVAKRCPQRPPHESRAIIRALYIYTTTVLGLGTPQGLGAYHFVLPCVPYHVALSSVLFPDAACATCIATRTF